jgi:post-segregation antitoxin (ccd killing protein)
LTLFHHAHTMRMMEQAFDINARKRPVNLTLNADLVEQVRNLTDNLSGVVEKLLADYLAQQRLAQLDRHRISEATCAAWNTFNREHGSIADEFSSL